jgi:ribosomal protein S18 acetylase RimI-like enzyme
MLSASGQAVLDHVAPGVFDDGLDAKATAAFLGDPRHHLVAAIDNGQVVGFTSAVHYVHPDKPHPEMWINEVGVAPSHRRRGVAKAILSIVLDLARSLNCSEVWVLTDRENAPAVRLYVAAGAKQGANDAVCFTFFLQP